MNDSVLKLEHLQEGFVPSNTCLKEIAGTRKPTYAVKLGNINYYKWYSTENVPTDRAMFITAMIFEILLFCILVALAVKNGNISPREFIILGCTALFIPFDLWGMRKARYNFFDINKNRQMLEILSGIGDDQLKRNAASDFLKEQNSSFFKNYWMVILSCILKLIGILLTVGLSTLPKLVFSGISVMILYVHIKYSIYFLQYYSALSIYNKEYKKSKHRINGRTSNEIPINIEIEGTDYKPIPDINGSPGFNFKVFSIGFEKNNVNLILYNNKIILDDTLKSAVDIQNSTTLQTNLAKVLILKQMNI